ncbi:MAG: 3'(2'),5'-bisphosphate nucleotidase CysQ [Nitrospinota bacterium]
MENQQEALLGTAIIISEEAGKAVMDIYSRGDIETTYKTGDSPLTLADMASHNIIFEQLKKKTPDIPVLSEESENVPYNVRKSWKTFWLVDPLDGTKEFINQNGEFTVNVALIDCGKTVLGVVHAPVLRTIYYASAGKGAFKKTYTDDERPSEIHVSDYHNGRLKIVASRSHSNNMLESFKRNVGDAEFTSMGSSLKLCLVAEGKAHLYPRLGPTMEWDTAAAQCIVESAGGTVTDLCKQTLNYNKPNLLNPFFMVSGKPPFPWWEYIDNI